MQCIVVTATMFQSIKRMSVAVSNVNMQILPVSLQLQDEKSKKIQDLVNEMCDVEAINVFMCERYIVLCPMIIIIPHQYQNTDVINVWQ